MGFSSYSGQYQAPIKELEQGVTRIVEKAVAVPFTIHRISKLTATDEGRQIWLNLCTYVHEITGKVWQHKPEKQESYDITNLCFYLPEGDVEALIHDMCHWVVATDEERNKPNLDLSRTDREDWLIRKEEMTWLLEAFIFSAVIGEPELVQHVSPRVMDEQAHYWVYVSDPVELTIEALSCAKAANMNVIILRRLLASWWEWRVNNPANDARPRGCLGWGTMGLPLTSLAGWVARGEK